MTPAARSLTDVPRPDRRRLASAALLAALLAAALPHGASGASNQPGASGAQPSFVVIYCDNLGYGDIGCFGSTLHRTPHIDRMAREGRRLTHFYSASGVCTPSRASLMTGSYPRRVGLHMTGPDGAVLRPVSPNGLHPEEVTIAEVLAGLGYATACVGKWRLGDQPLFLPTRRGFERFFGIPYSDDMIPRPGRDWPPLPLMRQERVVEAPADRHTLTKRYTEEVVRLLNEWKDRPFFICLPHAMPGSTPHPFASEAFRGKSKNGPYGDSVEEIDWSTGEILSALAGLGLDERTMVMFTSDNGAPRRNPPQGSNRPFSGWGYSTLEGGMRIPFVVRWPGKIPAGTVCEELATTMDLLPTLSRLAGGKPPADRRIDGRDIWPLLAGSPGAKSPHEAFYYYYMDQLQAVRSGPWKLRLALAAKRVNLQGKTAPSEAELYDLAKDPAESVNLAREHPGIVKRLEALAEEARAELGDGARPGSGQRKAGRVESPRPRVLESR